MDRRTPVDVTGMASGVVSVDAGFARTCALKSGAGGAVGVKCWGWNYGGAVGDGTTISRMAPVDVVGLASGAAAVTTGGWWHSCALMQSGGIKCWGTNSHGQIGVGTPVERYTPVDVPGVSGATSVATGLYDTCASVGGAAKCWGDNWAGQLGDGTAVLGPAPVQVSGLTEGVRIVAAGENHNCALMAGGYGGIKCWGLNTYGQLGNGSTSAVLEPADAGGLLSGVSGVTAGESHTCAC